MSITLNKPNCKYLSVFEENIHLLRKSVSSTLNKLTNM